MQAIDIFDATVYFKLYALFREFTLYLHTHSAKFTRAFAEPFFHECLQVFKFLGVKIAKSELLYLHAHAAHAQAVGHGCKYLERFAGDFRLLFGWHVAQCLQVVQTIGEFNDDHAHVLADSNQEFGQIVFGLRSRVKPTPVIKPINGGEKTCPKRALKGILLLFSVMSHVME